MRDAALHVIHDKFGPKAPTPTRRRPLSARARPRGGRRVPTSLHRPLIANARFPAAARRQPVRHGPSPAPCYASWALPGTARALARPIAVRSRAEGLDTDAARLPMPLVDSEGFPSRSAARAEARDVRPLRPLEPNFVRCSTRNALPPPFSPRAHARNDRRFRDLEPEIAHTLRDIPEITLGSSGVRKFL